MIVVQNPQECDVLVIGGGPAGSTTAALLAQMGRNVVLLEKDRLPRFHIGESLLPLNLPLFERLDVADEIRRIGVYKPGAEMVSDAQARRRNSASPAIATCRSIIATTCSARNSTNCCSTIAAASGDHTGGNAGTRG